MASDLFVFIPGIRVLSDSLQTNTSLTRLELAAVLMGEASATILADVLLKNKTLVRLNLTDNNFGDEGVAVFCNQGLKHCTTLHTLKFVRMGFTDVGGITLAGIIPDQPSLTDLDMGPNDGMTEVSCAVLKAALAINVTMRKYNGPRLSMQDSASPILPYLIRKYNRECHDMGLKPGEKPFFEIKAVASEPLEDG